MEYSDYTLQQIMESCYEYEQICNIFLSITFDSDTRSKLEDILYRGGYNGFSVSSRISSKDNPFIEAQRRISMAYLLVKNPETFDFLSQNKINLFHGTNANALPGILKFGLNSINESKRRNIDITTGEKWSRIGGERGFVSFTDVLDIALGYSTLKPSIENELLSFEVLICTTTNDVLEVGTCIVSSDVSEVGVMDRLPLENIKAICVPSNKVPFVKKIIDNNEIKVLAVDDIENKFYYVDRDFRQLHIFEKKLEELRNDFQKNSCSKTFKLEEIRGITHSRLISKIKGKLKKFESVIMGGNESDVRKKH